MSEKGSPKRKPGNVGEHGTISPHTPPRKSAAPQSPKSPTSPIGTVFAAVGEVVLYPIKATSSGIAGVVGELDGSNQKKRDGAKRHAASVLIQARLRGHRTRMRVAAQRSHALHASHASRKVRWALVSLLFALLLGSQPWWAGTRDSMLQQSLRLAAPWLPFETATPALDAQKKKRRARRRSRDGSRRKATATDAK